MTLLGNISKEVILEKYDELKTLSKTANYFKVSIELLRQYFIKNNIEYSKRRKYIVDNNFFKEDNEKSYYWAGFIAADGCVDKRLTISLGIKDKQHLENFVNDIKYTGIIKVESRIDKRESFKREFYENCGVRISSKEIISDLKRFNIIKNKSKIYKFPSNLDNKYIRHFIRGLIDGDGWIYYENNNRNIGLCGTTDCVTFVFNHLKKELSLESGYHKTRDGGLEIMGFSKLLDLKKIINYLYKDSSIHLKRKYDNAMLINSKEPRKISLDYDLLKLLKDSGKTNVDIGKILGCSNCTVARRMIEMNI